MKCKKCNQEVSVDGNEKFCPYCGQHIALPPKIPSVHDFGDASKIMFFDKCHEILVSFIQYRIDEGYDMKDMTHWAYETIQSMFDDEFWKEYRTWKYKK